MKFLDYLVLVLIILLLFALSSCTKDVEDVNACLLGDCDFTMQIDKSSQPDSYVDENGYHHIKFFGPKYFSVKTTYSHLKSNYVIANIPLIESQWDTNMWYTLVDGTVMWTSRYSPFGDFTANFSFSIPTSTQPVVIPSVSDLNELQNASGQYMRNGKRGPAVSTSPHVDYVGKQNFFFLPEMIGDTLVIENRTIFAYGSDVSESVKKTIKVILE